MRASRYLPLALFAFALPHCTCGKDSQKEAPEDIRALFERLFKSLPAAKVAQPIDAIPDGVSLVMQSPDPEAWRAWAVQQPFAKSMMETPLFDDVRLSRPWLALAGLRQNVARVSAFVGKKEDLGAIWRGPTAAAYVFAEGDAKDALLLVKRIDPSVRELVRFGAAFALAAKPEQGTSELRVEKEGELEIYTLERRGESVSFALFRDLLVAGTDQDLVARSALLAMGEARGEDRAASKGAHKEALPPPETPGLHLAFVSEDQEVAKLAGVSGLGLSLVADAAKPMLIRRPAGQEASEVLSLLRYAPSSTFLAVANGHPASEALLDAAGVPSELRELLAPGVAAIFDKGAVLALKHNGKKEELEPLVRDVLKEMTQKEIERVVLEDGSLILQSPNAGACVAISNDALLFAFTPERLRDALNAGSGKAPSLADRQGVDLKTAASGGVYFDLAKGSAFLQAFYAKNLGASPVLDPTFTALAGGGAYFSRLEKNEGAFHALP